MTLSENDYHTIFLFKRKKDNPELHKSTVCLFQDCTQLRHIRQRIPVYQLLARELDARVYISASPRDLRKTRKNLIIKLVSTEDSEQEQTDLLRQLMGSLMQCPITSKKKWVVDIDTRDVNVLLLVQRRVEAWIKQQDIGQWVDTEVKSLETPHGYHLITPPFDPRIIVGIPDVEIKKDGMTMLSYIGEPE